MLLPSNMRFIVFSIVSIQWAQSVVFFAVASIDASGQVDRETATGASTSASRRLVRRERTAGVMPHDNLAASIHEEKAAEVTPHDNLAASKHEDHALAVNKDGKVEALETSPHDVSKGAEVSQAKEKSLVKEDAQAGKASGEVEETHEMTSNEKAKADHEKAIQERVAREVVELGLTDSELDPDQGWHKFGNVAFQMKAQPEGGKEKCLSELAGGMKLRAVRCATDKTGQHWYWDDKLLKNLNSEHHCLGYSIHASGGHALGMYPCDKESLWTAWVIDDHGRLKSEDGEECIAFDEDTQINAVTKPCEDDNGDPIPEPEEPTTPPPPDDGEGDGDDDDHR